MDVRWRGDDDDAWLRDFLEREWGGTTMVVHGESIAMLALPALVAGDRDGIAIFRNDPAELVLLHAIKQKAGVGAALLAALVDHLLARGVKLLRATTTNDNLSALRFYKRHEFRLCALWPGAVTAARLLKPTIPTVGEDGIPMSDELDFELDLAHFV
jgi:GNAT superfamily N-acetyltransferase